MAQETIVAALEYFSLMTLAIKIIIIKKSFKRFMLVYIVF